MAEHPNIARLKEAYSAFEAGDMDKVREAFHPDIVWHVTGRSPLTGDYKGHEEVFGFFMKLMELSGGSYTQEMHDILANDEHATVLLHVHAEKGDKTLDENVVHVWHVDGDGKATEFWGFGDEYAFDGFYND